MSLVILLDAGPLGIVTNPKASKETQEGSLWLNSLTDRKIDVRIPEIADYEVRRELLRANKLRGVERLNEFKLILDYVPLTNYAAHSQPVRLFLLYSQPTPVEWHSASQDRIHRYNLPTHAHRYSAIQVF